MTLGGTKPSVSQATASRPFSVSQSRSSKASPKVQCELCRSPPVGQDGSPELRTICSASCLAAAPRDGRCTEPTSHVPVGPPGVGERAQLKSAPAPRDWQLPRASAAWGGRLVGAGVQAVRSSQACLAPGPRGSWILQPPAPQATSVRAAHGPRAAGKLQPLPLPRRSEAQERPPQMDNLRLSRSAKPSCPWWVVGSRGWGASEGRWAGLCRAPTVSGVVGSVGFHGGGVAPGPAEAPLAPLGERCSESRTC